MKKHKVKRKYWKDEEVEILKEKYHNTSNEELGIMMGATAEQIRCKGNSLGLKKDSSGKQWTRQECIDSIKKFHKNNGRSPSFREFCPEYNMPSLTSIKKALGTSRLEEVCSMVGIEMSIQENSTNGTTDWEWDIKETTKRVKRHCNHCGKEYSIVLAQYKKGSRFCSRECKANWQKTEENVGENNPLFTKVETTCDYCGKTFFKKKSKFEKEENHLCSNECKNKWFAEIYTQTKEWKDERRKIAVRSLKEGNVNSVDTTPNLLICGILDDMGIEYKKEEGFKYYAVDLFLTKYNIPIEIMGDYWHCNHLVYNEINYRNQVERIYKDKAKHNYISSEYGFEILYLWESDIYNNINVCKDLISKYIESKSLKNYHSFNYSEHAILNKKIDIPYMFRDSDEIRRRTRLDVIKERSKRDETKWIKYKCEYCGKDCEELISHYNKKRTHCCSRECSASINKKQVDVICACCGNEYSVKKSIYDKNKSKKFYCSKNCFYKSRRRIKYED